jgi:16S rRNA (guanine527-N7)-methyltransferase
MDIDRIAELLNPFLASPDAHNTAAMSCNDSNACDLPDRREPAMLSNAHLSNISTYINLLIRWNARMNLTAIRDPEEIVTRHFGESLFAARHLFPQAGATPTRVAPGLPPGGPNHPPEDSIKSDPHYLLDIGSGPGFPALPIKIWAPQTRLTLVESNQKKAAFLREVSRAVTLTNVNVLNSRAEDLPATAADTVTLRAVERFHSVLPVALRLVKPGGRLALLIGQSQVEYAKTLASVKWSHPISIPQSTSRVLLVGTRID